MATELIYEILGAGSTIQHLSGENLPVWIVKAVDIFTLRVRGETQLYLVRPKKDLPFEQIVNIVAQVEKRMRGITLFVADDVNTKFRSLFVKNNVPFVYKDKSIFAPMLGLKLFDYKAPEMNKNEQLDSEIAPLELKLVAGYLTGFIEREEFNLNQIEHILAKNNYTCSKAKLSQVVNHLIDCGFMEAKGSGPNRLVMFQDKLEVWDLLKEMHVKRFFKKVKGHSKDNRSFIISGESALAHYSDLVEPKVKHIGITTKEFKKLDNLKQSLGHTHEKEFIFDILKEPPELFAIDKKYLNPIELYFLLRGETDERILISLEQMLNKIGLKV
mgnify:FL=1